MNGKRDDIDARFEQFYAANFPRVKNFARLLTKSEEDAEDIAQNIFLKLWTRPELWEGQESMTGYCTPLPGMKYSTCSSTRR